MNQIAVRLAALVIIASVLPLPDIGAQGQNAITSQITDSTWRYFPCASGVIDNRERPHARKDHQKNVIKADARKRSRRAERRL